MATIELQPSGTRIEAEPGAELLKVVRQAGIEIDSPCGGEGTCGKCRLRVISGTVDPGHAPSISPEEALDGWVLACRAKVAESDVTIEVPASSSREGGQFADEDPAVHVSPHLLPTATDLSPIAVRRFVEVPPPGENDGLGDLDRLARAMEIPPAGPERLKASLPALRVLAGSLRGEEGRVTVTTWSDGPVERLSACEAGDHTATGCVAAVDVGTTTVAVQLIDAATGRVLTTVSDYNGQTDCGLDIISRINYAGRGDGLQELRRRVLETINGLLAAGAEAVGLGAGEVDGLTIAGNTTMTHLLLGLPPEHIRLAPYTPTVLDAPTLTAGELGIQARPAAPVDLAPAVGSYVGGDITSGLLCTELAADCEEMCLFVDVGTNGELVLGNRDFLIACACSAGPAFEGGGITCGMRAAQGAVEKAEVDPETGVCTVSTIGNAPPRGICGSGMIDLLANLLTAGWLDPAGKLDRQRPSPAIRVEGRRGRYELVPADQAEGGEALTIDETDIENLLRAKAAVYAGMSLMLEQVGIGFEDIVHVYVAGGFGRFLDLEQALVLGLIPDLPRERFRFLANASLAGAHMAAVSARHRRLRRELAGRVTYLDLSTDPAYMRQYTAALFLPHTDPGQFPSVAERIRTVRP